MRKLMDWQRRRHIRKIRAASQLAAKRKQKQIQIQEEINRKLEMQVNTVSELGPDGVRKRKQIGQVKLVPKLLSFRTAYEDTASFLNEVAEGINSWLDKPQPSSDTPNRHERRSREKNLPPLGSYWDYSTVEHISILPSLMLAAQYDRSRQLRNWAPRAINIKDWKPEVRRFLEEVGFLELCGVQRQTHHTIQYSNGSLLRLCRGEKADGKALSKYFSMMGLDLLSENPLLSEAINEAITNVVNHAYSHPDLCPRYSLHGWWLSGMTTINNGQREVSIMVYDQGASIPKTLPYSSKFKAVVARALEIFGITISTDSTKNDAEAILCAMELGKSATGETFRGKGLVQILDTLDLCKTGQLSIYSRYGSVLAEKTSNGSIRKVQVNHSIPIIGTAIVWQLVL